MRWLLLLSCLSRLALSARLDDSVHLSLLGALIASPRFHLPASGEKRAQAASLVYAASQHNVIAAITPKTGEIAWRQQLDEQILAFDTFSDALIVQSPTSLSLFQAATGHLMWSAKIGEQFSPNWHVTLDQNGIFAVQGGKAVHLSGISGEILWSWQPPKAAECARSPPCLYVLKSSGNPVPIRVLLPATPESLRPVISMHDDGSMSISQLDPVKGRPNAPATKLSHKLASPDQLLVFPDAQLLYLDTKGAVCAVCIGEQGITESRTDAGLFDSIQSLHLDDNKLFLGKRKDGSAAVVKLEPDCKLSQAYDFEEPATDAIYAGSLDREDGAHVSRFHQTSSKALTMTTWSSNATSESGEGIVYSQTLPYDTEIDGRILHITTEVVPKQDEQSELLSRSVFYTSAGTLQMWRGDEAAWVRQEGLYDVAGGGAVLVVDASEKSKVTDSEPEQHIGPQDLGAIVENMIELGLERALAIGKSLQELVQSQALGAVKGDWLSRKFGFRQTAIVGTPLGKLLALDLSAGASVLWEKLPFKTATSVEWKALIESGSSILAIAAVRDEQGIATTYGLNIDALTGNADLRKRFAGSPLSTFALPSQQNLVVVDENIAGHLYPTSAEQSHAPVYFSVQHSPMKLDGYLLEAGWREGDTASLAWTYSSSSPIESVVPAQQLAIGSIGRVLGNRDTLYKYLNPHLMAVTTASSVSLVDGVSGAVIFSSSHAGEVVPSTSIVAALAGHSLVYAFRDDSLTGKATRLVAVELYHHSEPNATFSSFSSVELPRIYSRSFIYPHGVKALGFTQTKLGITTRNLLTTTDQDTVVSIPRRLLDARRPMSKPTKLEAEEGLIAYDPLIPLDPRLSLSTGARVISSDLPRLKSVPTKLESTALVLSLGGDLFVGRATPSGTFDVLSEDFNKVQLFLTMLALAVALFVTNPLVQRKKLRAKWYAD